MTASEIRKAFLREFRGLCHRWNAWDVWSDWLVMASSAIYNGVHRDDQVEAEYLQAAKRYSNDELAAMARLLGMVAEALEAEVHDFLGSIFHELEMHNEARGQFFTPFDLCRMMARMTMPELPGPGRLLKLHEPASGSGAMVLAFHQVLTEARCNPARVYYWLVDLDDRAFRMAYIQCSLCGLSAEVSRGDSLAMRMDRTWRTPGFYFHDTPTRFRVDQMMGALKRTTDGPGPDSDAQQRPARQEPDHVDPALSLLESLCTQAGALEPVPADPPAGAADPSSVPQDACASGSAYPPDLVLPKPGAQFDLFGAV